MSKKKYLLTFTAEQILTQPLMEMFPLPIHGDLQEKELAKSKKWEQLFLDYGIYLLIAMLYGVGGL